MEMRRTTAAEAEDRPPPFIRPAPFSSRREREDLERELLQQQPPAAPRDGFVPTAVPVAAMAADRGTDSTFNENAVAVAVASAADRPPPPPVARSEARRCQGAVVGARDGKTAESEKMEFDDGVVVRPEPPLYDPGYRDLDAVPVAHALPTHESHTAHAQQTTASAALRTANAMGGMAAMEEAADVARARRGQGSIQRRTEEEVQWANARAAGQARKSDEGLAVDEGIHRVEPQSDGERKYKKKGDDDVRPFGTVGKDGTRGYEVKEYHVAEYDTTEYETAEYKSVYD